MDPLSHFSCNDMQQAESLDLDPHKACPPLRSGSSSLTKGTPQRREPTAQQSDRPSGDHYARTNPSFDLNGLLFGELSLQPLFDPNTDTYRLEEKAEELQIGRPRSNSSASAFSQISHILKRSASQLSDKFQKKRNQLTKSKKEISTHRSVKEKVKDFASILTADAKERRKFQINHRQDYEEKVENFRRDHPERRPDYEKTYIVDRQKRSNPGTSHENSQEAQDYSVLIDQYNALQTDHKRSDGSPSSRGMNTTSDSSEGNLAALHLTAEERHRARVNAYLTDCRTPEEQDGLPYTGLSRGQKTAMRLSRMLDPLRANDRKPHSTSMELGMMDFAPPGTMMACMRCNQPPQTYLTKGYCQQCYWAAS